MDESDKGAGSGSDVVVLVDGTVVLVVLLYATRVDPASLSNMHGDKSDSIPVAVAALKTLETVLVDECNLDCVSMLQSSDD